MQKTIYKSLAFLLVIMLCFSGCSSYKAPKEGVWYCDALRISIDFAYIYENHAADAAKLYAEDGSYTDILCYIDYGRGIFLTSQDEEIEYLTGEFQWQDNTLTITSSENGSVYTFEKISAPSEGE